MELVRSLHAHLSMLEVDPRKKILQGCGLLLHLRHFHSNIVSSSTKNMDEF